MSRNLVTAATPGSNGILVQYARIINSTTGAVQPATSVNPPSTVVTMSPAYGAAGAARLSPAGIVATVTAINTYLTGLSAANRDLVAASVPDGFNVIVTPTLVSVPCLYSNVATLASALATVTATAANTQAI